MKKIVCLILVFWMVSLSSASAETFEILTGEWIPYVSEDMEDGGPMSFKIIYRSE